MNFYEHASKLILRHKKLDAKRLWKAPKLQIYGIENRESDGANSKLIKTAALVITERKIILLSLFTGWI